MSFSNPKNNRILKSKHRPAFAPTGLLVICLLVCVLGVGLMALTGCAGEGSDGQNGRNQTAVNTEAQSPDLEYHDNGYGTIFVKGTRIEHPADTSTSIVVDWSREPAAKASQNLKYTEKKGIVYSRSVYTDGRDKGRPLDLHLNLKVPAGEAADTDAKGSAGPGEALHPVVILVPGGGFISCRIDNKYEEVQKYLVQAGYAVAIMEYHIIGQGRYMDAAKDVRHAIQWVIKEGPAYGLDPDRIALIGNSGGGYVAALAACMNGKNIQSVVNFYGLSDLLNNKADYEDAAVEAHHKADSSDSQFVNGVLSGRSLTDDLKEAAKADPASYIDGDEPPFLHLHGDQDLLVSPSQSLHLHEALRKAGVDSTRYVAEGAGHGDKAFRTRAAMDTVIEFLNATTGKFQVQRKNQK